MKAEKEGSTIVVNKNLFLKNIQKVADLCLSAHKVEMFQYVYFCTKEKEIILRGANGESYLEIKIPLLMSINPIEFAIMPEKLISIIKTIKDDDLTFLIHGNKIILNDSDGTSELPIKKDIDDLKFSIDEGSEESVVISGEEFITAFNLTEFSTSNEPNKYTINGISFVFEEEKIYFYSTDARRMGTYEIKCKVPQSYIGKRYILDKKPIRIAIQSIETKKIEEAKDAIKTIMSEVSFCEDSKGRLKINVENTKILTTAITGEMPDFKGLYPKAFTKNAKINLENLLLGLRRANITSIDNRVTIVFKDSEINLITNNGNAKTEINIKCEYEHEPIEIDCNITFVIDIVRALKTKIVQIMFNDKRSPFIITNESETYKGLIMPFTKTRE